MKLLFDENLSPDLPRLLASEFPDSIHVRTLNLRGAADEVIWHTAAAQGYALITKDDDFLELSVLRGAPPKVIALGLGNCRTTEVVALLRSQKLKLEMFGHDKDASLLELP